jgi:hypothetical protein
MSVDSGLVVVGLITLTYIVLVFGLFFYVKNEWCELLFKNNTVYTKKKRKKCTKMIIVQGDHCVMLFCRLYPSSPPPGHQSP